ncbi:BPTI/Kunitz domain-containing protein [Brachionichthys hirsutus]|uniref:BPTI/Kunitz domain-containing protein n=1 Tax=Brachionichthys hirsutus TaxID=412623 RepID=UPI0036052153
MTSPSFTTLIQSRKDAAATSSKMKYLLLVGIAFASFHISHSNIPAFCELPYDGGEGPNFNFALYYDVAKDECYPFLYKGQGGNANRFEHERECMRNCSATVENVYPMEESEACHFKHASGQCNGRYLRYYYDSIHDKCKKFHWTGCVGNGNRFLSLESCNQTCHGIHDDGDEEEAAEPDTPLAIICGLVLAVIVAAIIITVIVLTVKSKKKTSKKKTSGKGGDPKSSSPLQEQAIEMS